MSNLKIFDAHAHYDDESFNEDRQSVLKEIKESGILGIVNCGCSIETSKSSVQISKENDMFYAAVGIHPENALECTDAAIELLSKLSENKKVKAIGEIGLDYYYEENPPKNIQIECFKKQMKLAEKLNLPVVIHDRDAHKDTLDIIKEFPNVKGEVHCFSGSLEFAKECIKRGYYLGITGVVTFKNAKKIIEVVKNVPLEKIVVETDCPYMAPVPLRGKRNRSEYIKYIIEKISEIKSMDWQTVSEIILKNTLKLFNIDKL